MLLNVHQLTAGYGNLIVLREISFSMKVGETLAAIGSNGAGKSTLLWALSGMIRPKSGQVLFGEQDITGWGLFSDSRPWHWSCSSGNARL